MGGYMGGWTKTMLAARDGSIPLLQRGTNVAALSANVAKEINKVGTGGPLGTMTTAVHLAASRGHVAALEWLLKRGGEVDSAAVMKDQKAHLSVPPAPHHLASAYGHTPALDMLLAYKADLSARFGLKKETAYDVAARAGRVNVVTFLSTKLLKYDAQTRMEL